MFKFVVFDFGQVLVKFDPKYMVEQYVNDPEDSALLQRVVFDRVYWDKLDKGEITDREVLSEVNRRIPQRLFSVAEKIYYNWIYNIPEIDGMREVVEFAKQKTNGKIYLLSNISAYFAEHKEEIPILQNFDNCVFSATCGHIKPYRDIFAYLCEKYELTPFDTLFIDDNAENIKGAESFGIKGYLFDGNTAALKEYLKKVL